MLTASPVYPLFDGFFKHIRHAGRGDEVVAGVVQSNWGANIFQRREMMFGEGFWETILIPVRMSFQRKDSSASILTVS
jgi:hypothetical protein